MSREQWRELAREVLRRSGKDAASPEEALATPTYDGVTLAPLYDAADLPPVPGLPPSAGREPGLPWEVRQLHETADPEAVMADLENGADSLWLAVAPEDLPRVLDGVHLDLISVVLDAGPRTGRAAEALLALAGDRAGALRGSLGADPLGDAARSGAAPDLSGLGRLARLCADRLPGMRAITVDATPYHEAGGSDAEELGCSIATGLAYLRSLTEDGVAAEEAFGWLEFRYAATADQFATIAKLRAARLLWARVAEVCDAPPAQYQHAVTSAAMMTRRDPYTNMLRTTVACFAAGVGGADAVTVRPFDAALGLPDDFSRRIARNTSALLVEESHVARTYDPAGGSWYVERRTADLAERAWAWFQEIEEAGGMTAARGLVADRLAATRARRARDLARLRPPIVGVSRYPDPAGKLPARAHAPRPAADALPRFRHAQDFEDLLDQAEDARPRVFLATVGPAAEHAARLAFARGLFEAGGVETVTGAVEEFAASGARVACLCSSDRLYAGQATEAAAALRQAGARWIWLAGRDPHDGVDANLYAGCDVLDVLRTTLSEVTA
ncbi:Methylmalonyl-CoA mutase small subunit [Nonomuraea coxensis DSM 45129]|uniref:methylmalonyl-CoA mutase n=1 Tax=Nonomuraea coxensis DSM 45129 TaxID=1122611 RepID=A0ABX8U490_9ACTN|nr:methylmalonyl-CoA mutase subunit beta [Nonomuraea coxensis]QYC41564.1 Methylmalonyl-CoA mutase small subunit [Nonomuraea coxensis DSM 45129]